MADFVPPESSGVMALIALMNDPKAFKAKLEEYNKARRELEKARVEGMNAERKAREDYDRAIAAKQDMEKLWAEVNEKEAAVNKAMSALEAEKKEFAQKSAATQKRLDDLSVDLENRSTFLVKSEYSLAPRIKAVEETEAALAVKEKEVERLRADYEGKLAKMRELAA